MDVAGPPFKRGKDDRIDEPDDRAGLFLGDLFDRDGFVTAFVLTDELQLETFGRLFQHALRRFRLLEQVLNLGKRRDANDQIAVEQVGDFVDGTQIAGVRHRDDKGVALFLQGYKVVTEHQLRLNRSKQFEIQVGAAQFNKITPVTLRELFGRLPVVADREFFHDWIWAPRLNMGRYKEMRMYATNPATKIRIIGS